MAGSFARCVWIGMAMLCAVPQACGYSVLTHEAVIDSAWKDNIQVLLLKRFPNATPDELHQAQAYAYGGAIIQDMGYYPFGSKLFSDLTHYVRSGTFVMNLVAEAQTLDEYAFALGAIAHYAGDNRGHRVAVNRVVPIMFPKLRKEFGTVVTYADNSAAHMKVEFSFDVVQVAQGHYAPQAYHDFVGFEVAKGSLERAFEKTYSLDMPSLFLNEDLALSTYRYAVSSVMPTMTKAAWSLKKKDILKDQPTATKRKFIYNISRSEYRKTWGGPHTKPGVGARIIAFVFRILPKVGPLRALSFQPPTPAAEKMFLESFNETLADYKRLLAACGDGSLQLEDDNFDTGEPTKAGAYRLADDTYAKLVAKLEGKTVPPDLRADILSFYADRSTKLATRRDDNAWKKLMEELAHLRDQKPDGM